MDVVPVDARIALAALMLEACIGYPRPLLAAVGHPVMWIGRLLDAMERRWNDPQKHGGTRRLLGIIAVVVVVSLAAGSGYVITQWTTRFEYGVLLIVTLATAGLAQRSLHQHVRDVLMSLHSGDLDAARRAVGRIVGRDTHTLTAADVASAAIESLAESFNDAVVAPAFWLLIGGLPGLFAYKAINTADSMIGHREERWRLFGWAAARSDDVANLVPARVAGVLLATARGRGFAIMWRDAHKHASPNAGWTEAALAGALDVRLGGPTAYDGVMHARPYFGVGRKAEVSDVARALSLYRRACGLLWLLLALGCVLQLA